MFATEGNAPDLQKAKLELEIANLRHEGRWPWLAKVGTSALVAAMAAGFGGWIFSDNLRDRTRAEIRRDIIALYLATENTMPGKRTQILEFFTRTLVDKDDEELVRWLAEEKKRVEAAKDKLDSDIGGMTEELDAKQKELKKLLDEARGQRVDAEAKVTQLMNETQSKQTEIAALKAEIERGRIQAMPRIVPCKGGPPGGTFQGPGSKKGP